MIFIVKQIAHRRLVSRDREGFFFLFVAAVVIVVVIIVASFHMFAYALTQQTFARHLVGSIV